MYAQGSQECLKNAERLFGDATILLRNKSFGAAQSLIVTALEEAGKAIILELANLNYVGKEAVEQSMRDHRPKKLVLLAMEKGLLFVDRIDRRNGSCKIDKSVMQKLENALKAGLKNLENKRQNGFYVQVDVNNGVIVDSPNNIEGFEVEELAKKAKSFLKLSNLLCEFFRDYRVHPNRNNLRIFQENLENFNLSYDEV
jgi:AbiV family abortive infection protein